MSFPWTQTSSEFFPLYLLSGLVLTILFLKFQFGFSFLDGIRYLFADRHWRSKSVKMDFFFSMLYAFFLYAPVAATTVVSFDFVYRNLSHWMLSWHLETPKLSLGVFWSSVSLTVVSMMAIDFGTYVSHRMLHKWAYLWPIHSVHHSAEFLNIFATHRQHPIEPFFLNAWRGAMSGVAVALFDFAVWDQAHVMTYMNMGIGFFIYMLTVNLHHLHVPIRYPRVLRLVFISPHVHHIHHSTELRHRDVNFGVVFSIWDRAFGTYYEEDLQPGQLTFGVDEGEVGADHNVLTSFLRPVLNLFGFDFPGASTKLEVAKQDNEDRVGDQEVS